MSIHQVCTWTICHVFAAVLLIGCRSSSGHSSAESDAGARADAGTGKRGPKLGLASGKAGSAAVGGNSGGVAGAGRTTANTAAAGAGGASGAGRMATMMAMGTGTGADACAVDSQDDACVGCVKSSCCTQLDDCAKNSTCTALATCTEDCLDSTCVARCAQQHPGTNLYPQLLDCAAAQCAAQCGDDSQANSAAAAGVAGSSQPATGSTASCAVTNFSAEAGLERCFNCMLMQCCEAVQACDQDEDCVFCEDHPLDTSERCVDPHTFDTNPLRKAVAECQTARCVPPCGAQGGSQCIPSDCSQGCPNYSSGCR